MPLWRWFLLTHNPLLYIFNPHPRRVLNRQRGSVISLVQKISAVLLAFTLPFASNIVFAQESNRKASDSNIGERINFIQTSFDKGETSARAWSYTWTGLYGALTGLQTFQTLYTRHDRTSNIVNASQSLVGLAVMIVDPFHPRSSGNELRKIPGNTPEEQQHKLDMAEIWLERNYKQEKFGRSWPIHLLGVAVSIIGGGIAWHNNGSKNGITTILSGIAVSEVQIWTQPTRGMSDYNEYRRKYKAAYHNIPEKKYFIAPSLNGLVVGVTF